MKHASRHEASFDVLDHHCVLCEGRHYCYKLEKKK